MIKTTATNLRKNLFEYLDRAEAGETIVIQRNNKEIARIVGNPISDWRDNTKEELTLLVSPEELLAPLDDVWEEYT